jgi:hypothetical protein
LAKGAKFQNCVHNFLSWNLQVKLNFQWLFECAKKIADQLFCVWLLTSLATDTRVARWFIFKPKIPFWVNFGGSLIGES